ncbi:apolipoprotein C-II isoform X2 [Castor canadensis]|uniref:Apolipoprotein C-II isoform X2 n=1 Tax=Castor canadensis TaxID=51338 RepID=A0AC58L976_CASCN
MSFPRCRFWARPSLLFCVLVLVCTVGANTMGPRFLLALCFVLLVLACEAQQDEPASQTLLAQVQESLSSYWDTAKAAAQGLYEKTYLTSMDEKLRDMYSKGSAAMTTYAGIVTDQILTLLKGD